MFAIIMDADMEVVILKRIIVLLTVLLLLPGMSGLNITYADDYNEGSVFNDIIEEDSSDVFTKEAPLIDAGAAVVMDMKSGRILYEKNAYSKRAMASTTKIMTAILAIEKGNPDDDVVVSERADSIWGSTIGIRKGEVFKLSELLYGLMLSSGNDAAIAVAEHIGGTVENFAEMMTQKAREIGAKNTSFKTPHGLDMDGHYTTAYDLALITRYALANSIFSSVVGTKYTSIKDIGLSNTNELLTIYPGADGVKTGYTGKAGRCLVSSATRNNRRIIAVVLNCSTRSVRAQSSIKILNYAFDNYKPCTLITSGEKIKEIPVSRGVRDSVLVKSVENVEVPLRFDEIDAVEKRVYLSDSLEAPVYAGSNVGVIEFVVNGEIIGESPLAVWSDVRKKGVFDYLEGILNRWIRQMREGIFLKP
jgi:D-alanyl-D-alanine carboxypeptidase (penicillin-binding protein 5/6)